MKLLPRLVAAVLACWPGLVPASAAVPCRAGEFRAMTYNIRLDTEADGPNRWSQRRDLFIGQIRLLHPAILGMQEVVPGQRNDLEAALPDYVSLGGGRDGGRKGEASPLFVDRAAFRVGSSGMFWLSPTPDRPSKGWDAAFPRVVTWAHLVRRADGLRVLAINTHWDHVGLEARRQSALQLQAWIAAHRAAGETLILLGDFNAPLAEASLANLLATGLRDARAASIEPAIGSTITFNGWEAIPAKGETIDHVLVGPGLAVRRYHALAEQFDGRLASDHFPVIADLVPSGCGSRPPA